MAGGLLYTEAELLRAIELREGGRRPWADVAAAMGRPPRSLSHAVWRYRTGVTKGVAEQHAIRRARIVRLYETTDLTPSEIGRAIGMLDVVVNQILTNAGLDCEMRRELRREQAAGLTRHRVKPPGTVRERA